APEADAGRDRPSAGTFGLDLDLLLVERGGPPGAEVVAVDVEHGIAGRHALVDVRAADDVRPASGVDGDRERARAHDARPLRRRLPRRRLVRRGERVIDAQDDLALGKGAAEELGCCGVEAENVRAARPENAPRLALAVPRMSPRPRPRPRRA